MTSEQIEVTDAQDPTEEIEIPTQEVDIPKLVEASKNPPPKQEPEEEKAEKFDPKKDWVEFSTPEQKAKFDYMYKQTKNADTRNAMLMDLLQKQQEQLDSITGRFTQEDENIAEQAIQGKIRDAVEEGDTDAQTKAIDELVKYRLSKLGQEKTKKSVNEAPQYDPQDVRTVEDFAYETTPKGDLKRPWLHQDHPDFLSAVQKAQTIASQLGAKNPNDPALVYKVLQRLDDEMTPPSRVAPKGNSRAPDPMATSNLTQQANRGTIKLSRAELDICKKLGVDPKNYHAQKVGM